MGVHRGRVAFAAAASAILIAALGGAPAALAATPAADCQPFGNRPCMLPFPDNRFSKADPTSATGLRVQLPRQAMPTNTAGQQIKVAAYNRNDGFSPGSMIVARVRGLDNPTAFNKTNPVRLTDMSQAFKPSAPIVVIDAKTGDRHLIWAELDSNASDPGHTTLLIHPGRNFAYGHRYIVALRNLKDKDGNTLQAPSWFEALRDNKPDPELSQRQRQRYASIFKTLGQAGIARSNLYEAWDFTVGSRQGLAGRMLKIRNDAFGQLGDHNLADSTVQGSAPAFHVDNVQNNPATGIMRYVTGTFTVPCYLQANGCPPGSSFNYSSSKPDALPTQKPGNVATAPFYCIIPNAAATTPGRASLYGHGLLGNGAEVTSGAVEALASEHDFVICATDWWGLSQGDVAYDISALKDLNNFPPVVDRLQQGVLNTLYLGRLMRTAGGLASDPAFQNGSSQSMIDTSHLYYDGNSQGGIMGGMTTAVAPDLNRAALGVPGMDYGGLLLQRSSDFPAYANFLFGNSPGGGYTDSSIHPLILDLMQQLWDRGEADGYAQSMTSNPPPDTPPHNVLMHVAYDDHQVSQFAAAVEARTIGAKVHAPALDPARARDKNLFYGIPSIPSYPFNGSAIVIWDSGPGLDAPPPVTNTPPTDAHDPHGDPRATVAARTQISNFLKPAGAVPDVCGGQPCHTDVFTP
ncbi:MAG: hypothetical protein AUG48_01320 [Actinobacteria bacterium 13_1_20CM_3_68_9]|nr:MAG: hypothetical protein AUG48_01320 [Actinobacteria bacterium 13_1_20CM_3_68_9]